MTARDMWPQAEWIEGSGPYAVVAPCRVLTVTLHQTLSEAAAALDGIDRIGCGGGCDIRSHRFVILNPAEVIEAEELASGESWSVVVERIFP